MSSLVISSVRVALNIKYEALIESKNNNNKDDEIYQEIICQESKEKYSNNIKEAL